MTSKKTCSIATKTPSKGKRYIHVNQHVIRANLKTGRRDPVLTVKSSKSNQYGHEVHIDGPCRVVYTPDKPLSCGARVYIVVEGDVPVRVRKKRGSFCNPRIPVAAPKR